MAALAACCLILLLGTAATAAPTPAPAPTSGGFVASTWECSGSEAPQAVPSPGTDTSTSCTVTSWATIAPAPAASGGACGDSATPCPVYVAGVDPNTYGGYGFGLLLIVLCLGALVMLGVAGYSRRR